MADDRQLSIPDHRIQHAIDNVFAHIDEDTGLEALAGEACLSPFHSVRVFRRHTGQLPMGYVTGLRMRLAERLLVDTELPVAAVAAQCGYSRPSAFTNAVRRHLRREPEPTARLTQSARDAVTESRVADGSARPSQQQFEAAR